MYGAQMVEAKFRKISTRIIIIKKRKRRRKKQVFLKAGESHSNSQSTCPSVPHRQVVITNFIKLTDAKAKGISPIFLLYFN